MASLYTPVAANIEVTSGFNEIKKYPVPFAQRSYPVGTPMWYNNIAAGTGGVEPALLSTTANGAVATNASSTTYSSTYTSVAAADAVFAPLFAGFAADARVPQQEWLIGNFAAPGGTVVGPEDASRPYIGVYSEGIATCPLLTAVVTNPVEPGTLVAIAGFANEATTGFYDAAGCLQKDTNYYLHNNAVVTTATAANAIGVVCERAPVGSLFLKISFKSALLNPTNVL